MARPGRNIYYADTKTIKAGGAEDFTFTIDEDGFIWLAVDGKVGDTPFHALATCPLLVKSVTRKFAGADDISQMGQGDIALDLFARMGADRQKFFYEEPLKGSTKVKINVANTSAGDLEVQLVMWGANPKTDPFYVPPEDWPKLTPYRVAEYQREQDNEE